MRSIAAWTLTALAFAFVGACEKRQTAAKPATPPPNTTAPTTRAAMADIGTMYFSRAARFDRMGDKVVAIDPNAPRVISMDPWPQLVFEMADGQHTVAQLRAHLASQYDKGAPAGLDGQIASIIRDLQSKGLIRLHPAPTTLPFYLAKPVAQQDPEEARKAMERDGFIRRGT